MLMMEMDMESHGSVSTMKRQSQHKTTGQSLLREPLSACSELHSHPLAEQDQICGRPAKAEGHEGPMAPVGPTVLMSFTRTRWLNKLRSAGAPQRRKGMRARWHLSGPLCS